VITPLLTQCGIQGIMRAYIISLLAKEKFDLVERSVSEKDVNNADRIFFTNSIIGLWFVNNINNTVFSSPKKNHDCSIIAYLQNEIITLEKNS
ncbi:MAG: aminotransferase class IV, partial [Cocleimonas sp.]|nr:aminotransferase class IV [Sulfurovaceae bacterium]MCK5918999.1 aminotransferase class IV [Cocleimonas sp.]